MALRLLQRPSWTTPRPGPRRLLSSSAAATPAPLRPAATPAPLVSVGVIGVGQMGTAMLKAFLKIKGPNLCIDITVSDIDPLALERAAALGVATTLDNRAVIAAHDVLLIGTEPEDVPHVLDEIYATTRPKPKLLISIAAGLRTETMLERVPGGTRVVRVMPNTPCVVGEMAAGYCMGPWQATQAIC